MIILKLGKNASNVTNLPERFAEPKQAGEKVWKKPRTSYRTRRSLDPWFDRPFDRPFDRLTVLSRVEGLTVLSKVEGLTTLSEVEGVSSKRLFSLDSPPQADFATSEMTDSVPTLKNCDFQKRCIVFGRCVGRSPSPQARKKTPL
jgi:hypothetical protein